MSAAGDGPDFWINADDGVWWSPEGWMMLPKPPTIARRDGSTVVIPYNDCGFWPELTFGGSATNRCIEIQIYSSTDALVVEIWGPSAQLARFFVARWHEVQFYADKLPSLLAGYGRWIIEPESQP